MKNKIYWKSLISNCTIRLFLLWKYRSSEWREFYAPKIYWTEYRRKQGLIKIDKLLKELSSKQNNT